MLMSGEKDKWAECKDALPRYHARIVKLLKQYMDMPEENYNLIALWIIGTYFHKMFNTFPYLYFNATKGSGKTRILKMISTLSWNGSLVGSNISEAVLFRTASQRTLCIDEIENIHEKPALCELLNSAYKIGLGVERMSKRKTADGEHYETEKYDVFCPVALANISGMENVLSDRCITLILEKSMKSKFTLKIENFDDEKEFQYIKNGLLTATAGLLGGFQDIYRLWNAYADKITQESGVGVANVGVKDIHHFTEIYVSGISGRHLEVFFPLFLMADMVSYDCLIETVAHAQILMEERNESDKDNNKDVKMVDFVKTKEAGLMEPIIRLSKEFAAFCGEDERWHTSRSILSSLRRLNLIKSKKRLNYGWVVILDIEKATSLST